MRPGRLRDGRNQWWVGPVRLTIDDLVTIAAILRGRGGWPYAKARVDGRFVHVAAPEDLARYLGAPGLQGFGLTSADLAVSVILDRRQASVVGPPGDPVTHAVVQFLRQRFSPFASLLNTVVLLTALGSAAVAFAVVFVLSGFTVADPRSTWGLVALVAIGVANITATGQGGAHVRR